MKNPFGILKEFFNPMKSSARRATPPKTGAKETKQETKQIKSANKEEGLGTIINKYRMASAGSDEEQQIISMISKWAVSFQDWLFVLDNTSPDTTLGMRTIERLKALAASNDEWKELLIRANADPALKHLKEECVAGMERMLKEINSLEDLEAIYDDLSSDSPLIPIIIKKIEAGKESLEECLEIYSSRDSTDDFSITLLKKAINLTRSPDDWISLWEATENSDRDLKAVGEAFGHVQWPKEKWEELRDKTDSGSELETIAFRRILENHATPPDILRFYLDYVDNWETDEGVVDEILEKLFSLTTRREVEIIALLGADETLVEIAENRLRGTHTISG